MNDVVTIDRELLEQVAAEFEHDNDRYMLGRELRKVLAAPRQPEGEGLEVVGAAAISNDGTVLDMSTEHYIRRNWEGHAGYQVEPLCRLSDAQRAIAELQEVNRIQLEIETVHGAACVGIRQQRDKLAGLLREVRTYGAMPMSCQIGMVEVCHCSRCRFERIDAALAEVKP